MKLDREKRIEIQKEINESKISKNTKDLLNRLLDESKLGLKLYFEESEETTKNKNGNDIPLSSQKYIYFDEDESKRLIINEDKQSHILIEGDNYFALKHLQKIGQKVDIIYIDPPYNTGNKDTGLIYNNEIVGENDLFIHSKFISFMKRRLSIAKNILNDDGVIFIAIDDAEMAYLKVLADEIFGERNFISALPIRSNPNGREVNGVVRNHEYILVYKKSEANKKDFLVQNENLQKLTPLRRGGENSLSTERPRRFYPILEKDEALLMIDKIDYESIYVKNEKIDELAIKRINDKYSDYNVIWPVDSNGIRRVWQREYDRVLRELNSQIIFENGTLKTKAENKTKLKTWLDDEKFSYSHHGAVVLKTIIPDTKFRYPKSSFSIKYLLSSISKKDSIIMDFFAGSGTTGQAIMEMNNEDGGKRKFIGITLGMEKSGINICKEVTYERLHRISKGKGTKGEEDFKWLERNKPYKQNLKYLKVKHMDKFDGNLNELNKNKQLYKEEFNADLTIELIADE